MPRFLQEKMLHLLSLYTEIRRVKETLSIFHSVCEAELGKEDLPIEHQKQGGCDKQHIFFKYLGKGKSTAVCGFLKDSIQVNLRRLRRYSKSVCQFDLQYFNDYVNPRSK